MTVGITPNFAHIHLIATHPVQVAPVAAPHPAPTTGHNFGGFHTDILPYTYTGSGSSSNTLPH